jgi:hypothetical protein
MGIKTRLTTLWIFVILNYLYADLLGLMDPNLLKQFLTGTVGTMAITQEFLLAASILMESAMIMVVLSLFLNRRWNRWANMAAALLHTGAVGASLFVGTATMYYVFFSTIEILTTLAIVWLAWTWKAGAAEEVKS